MLRLTLLLSAYSRNGKLLYSVLAGSCVSLIVAILWSGGRGKLSGREGFLSADSWVAPPLPHLALTNPGSSEFCGDTRYSTLLYLSILLHSRPSPAKNAIGFSSSSSSYPLSSQLPHCTVCTCTVPCLCHVCTSQPTYFRIECQGGGKVGRGIQQYNQCI